MADSGPSPRLDALPADVIAYPLAGIRAYLDGTRFAVSGWDSTESDVAHSTPEATFT
ncbi:hypothetical protein [Alloactinosynnema sp. L-07]|uniref:hypothetical protein n=1 Tax=Alloactinosynnema sp. L-07 TaxID=1653480 RepID=UPI00065EF074|nr:hypothetical protein [Alloactinosynnema sp. L-07]CRK60815.1 hypothetical protein [Alloactinosynnema sp. L-07]